MTKALQNPAYTSIIDTPSTDGLVSKSWRAYFDALDLMINNGFTGPRGPQGLVGPQGPQGIIGADKTQTLTFTSPQQWDTNLGRLALLTLPGNTQLQLPQHLTSGTYVLIVKQDATGGRVLTFAAGYLWAGGSAPTMVTTANAVNIITFVSNGTSMFGVGQADFK